ncbi:hypothetical protein PWT90_08506 [Aphanocladium album]|nr:hypothetical protein PWT90_08506 [Aphanocladium album]
MNHQTVLLQPTPGAATALFTASFILVLTPAALDRVIRKQQPMELLHRDQNGAATTESQRRADATSKSASVQALTIGSVGLAMAAMRMLREAHTVFAIHLDTAALTLICWILLSAQAAYAVGASTCTRRYTISRAAVLGSLIATLYFIVVIYNTENYFWRELPNLAILLVFAAALACVPCQPTLYTGDREVLNRQGSSLLSWITFSYGFLHRSSAAKLPGKLTLEHVPAVNHHLRAKILHDRFRRVGNGASLWLQLGQLCLKPLVLQWFFVLAKSLSEFGSRYSLFNLLRCMEDNRHPINNRELWKWTGMMSSGLFFGALADAWLLWTTAGILYGSVDSVLQAMVLEKFMRKEVGNGESKKDKLKSSEGKAQAASNAMFKETQSIARAVLDNYYFPMAAFKIILDIYYLTQLLSVTSLVAGALFPIVTTLLSKSLAQQHQVFQRSQTTSRRKTIASLTEMLQNLHHIRLSSLESFWGRRLQQVVTDEQSFRWSTSMALERLNFFSSLGPILLASTAISVHALEAGALRPAVAFTALSFFSNLQGVFAQLPAKAAALHKSWISVQDLQDYLQQPNQRKCAVEADELFLEEASLAWLGTLAMTDSTQFRLTDITLRFPTNGLSVITGKVGSGKSLLLAALLDEAAVIAGRLGRPRIGGSDTDGIDSGSMAYVSQPPWIGNSSIRDNIVFGYTFDAERYEKVIKACALDHDLAALEDGDMTVTGTGGSALSGGQKWRIALARAFYSPNKTLILEDVLGAVDTPIASWICKHALTGEIAAGRTVILATHRPEFCIAAAQYTVTIENGTAFGKEQTPISLTETSSNSPVKSPTVAVSAEKKSSSLNEKQPPPPQSICHTWWLLRWTSSSDSSPEHAATIGNVGLYILLSVAGVLALAVQSLVFTAVGMNASRALYWRVVQRVLGATLLWIDSTPFGRLFETIDSDMHVIDNLIAPALNGIFGTILQLGIIIVASLRPNYYTAISSIATLALYAHIGPRMIEPNRKLRGLLGPAAHPVSDHTNAMVLGLTTIRAFGRTQLFMDRFYELVDNSSTIGIHIQLGNCWTTVRSGLLGCAFVTATAAAMVYNNIDAATTGLTITLALQMRTTLAKLLSQFSTIRMGLFAADRVIALTEVPLEPDGGRETPNWPSQGVLEVDTISLTYGPQMPLILRNISFSALPHERIGIVGRTGAGKSSLTNALLRFIEPATGEVRIDGVSTAEIVLSQLRGAVKIIPQDPLLFTGTLRCNLDPSGEKTDAELVAVLKRVRLINDKHERTSAATDSFELEMNIEPSGANLSHGQRQQICLARAILSQCRILVLDEATSGMDDTTAEVIQQIIKQEFATTTVIVIAHKLLTVAQFDKILVMSQGEVSTRKQLSYTLQNRCEYSLPEYLWHLGRNIPQSTTHRGETTIVTVRDYIESEISFDALFSSTVLVSIISIYAMNPHVSERLVYTTFDSEQHGEFLWTMHNDPVSWTNACAQIQRPMDRDFHAGVLAHKRRQLLFVIIYAVASSSQDEPQADDQAPNRKLIPVGHLVLEASDSTTAQHRDTTLSIGIHKDHRRKGYGFEAINWALDWAFNYANMHRVDLSVYGWNEPALALYLKVGFREEGRKREKLFLRGKYWDEILMSVLVHEWRVLRGLKDDGI